MSGGPKTRNPGFCAYLDSLDSVSLRVWAKPNRFDSRVQAANKQSAQGQADWHLIVGPDDAVVHNSAKQPGP